MKKINLSLILKLSTFIALILVIWVFFFFEISFLLRILVIFLGIISLWQIEKNPEIVTLLILYLGLYDFYNIRYGLAIPMAIIMIAVLGLTSFLFLVQVRLLPVFANLSKDLFNLYLIVTDLIVLEIFLTMSFWPVDPKTKSLCIVVVFYSILKIVYLRTNNMLSLKRTSGIILFSTIVLACIFTLGWWLGF